MFTARFNRENSAVVAVDHIAGRDSVVDCILVRFRCFQDVLNVDGVRVPDPILHFGQDHVSYRFGALILGIADVSRLVK